MFKYSQQQCLNSTIDIGVYFSSDYIQDLVVQVFVSSMAKPSCRVHCVAFDLCALRAYAQTVALFLGLPSFQILLGLPNQFTAPYMEDYMWSASQES